MQGLFSVQIVAEAPPLSIHSVRTGRERNVKRVASKHQLLSPMDSDPTLTASFFRLPRHVVSAFSRDRSLRYDSRFGVCVNGLSCFTESVSRTHLGSPDDWRELRESLRRALAYCNLNPVTEVMVVAPGIPLRPENCPFARFPSSNHFRI
jgi:hypothetical protein